MSALGWTLIIVGGIASIAAGVVVGLAVIAAFRRRDTALPLALIGLAAVVAGNAVLQFGIVLIDPTRLT